MELQVCTSLDGGSGPQRDRKNSGSGGTLVLDHRGRSGKQTWVLLKVESERKPTWKQLLLFSLWTAP